MTHEFLDAPRLRAVCDMQREQIRSLRRQLAEKDARNQRLQEQVCDLVNLRTAIDLAKDANNDATE